MFSIIYLEQKLVTRDSLKLSIEKQEECKVLFSTGSIDDFCDYIKNEKQIPDLCKDCTHVKACSGGYYPTRYSSVNNSLNNPSAYCKGLFAFFDHLKLNYANK